MSHMRITIEGADAFERTTLASEICALLESLTIRCELSRVLPVNDDEEHARHLGHLATHAFVLLEVADE